MTVRYSDRNTSPIKATLIESRSLAMTEMANSIKMLACDTVGNRSTPAVDGLSMAKRDANKIVEGMWKAGEVVDYILLIAARIFQDSTKAKMFLNLEDPRIQRAYLD
ncbi:hypothetical protein AMTR_s00062p00209210 [Amborella trichopoda]|uniref:Uncharacterized protein n=1 Tax=Amborella trichopoda TaxID=13333 RepID=U5DH13_AMBTC|nr:hypothetical protein AMTR_s00062p00209210 [Amborella trichopoda]